MGFCSDRPYECSYKNWSRERGGHRGLGVVPFERALVSSYRPSIVSFHLSLRVLEILPLLVSIERHFFPTPFIVSPKFPHVPLGSGGSPFGYKERRLIVCAISFQDFQPMWSQSTNDPDGQTVGWTTCDRKTALCTGVHWAVKTYMLTRDQQLNNCFKKLRQFI